MGYSPWGHKDSDMIEPRSTHTHIILELTTEAREGFGRAFTQGNVGRDDVIILIIKKHYGEW